MADMSPSKRKKVCRITLVFEPLLSILFPLKFIVKLVKKKFFSSSPLFPSGRRGTVAAELPHRGGNNSPKCVLGTPVDAC